MNRLAIAICSATAAVALCGCADYGYYGYGYGYGPGPGPGPGYVWVDGPIDVWYDDYYGPYPGGYRDDDAFYYRQAPWN